MIAITNGIVCPYSSLSSKDLDCKLSICSLITPTKDYFLDISWQKKFNFHLFDSDKDLMMHT